MTRINALRNIRGPREFLAWGKTLNSKNLNNIPANVRGSVNALIFSAVLIACSLAVGCSSDKPKPVSSTNQVPATQVPSPIAPTPAPVMQAENKPAPKKVVHKKPATVNYADKTYGVTFEYPRRYAIETGTAAADLLTSSPIPMNFVQPGGVALAAVELPETSFANTDFSSAFFNVSVHKGLNPDQCSEFAVPQPKVVAMTAAPATSNDAASSTDAASATESKQAESTQAAATQTASSETSNQASTTTASTSGGLQSAQAAETSPTAGSTTASSDLKPASTPSSAVEPQGSKLMIGDLELRATEAVSGEGTRQSDAKYFHVFQNGACYEFAVNVTTVASEDGLIKHVDRDKVFDRLEKILATVKIEDVKPATPEVSAEAPAAPATQENPAQ
jgi:hypothetical protein